MIRIAYISADPGVPVFGRKGCSVHVQEMVRALVRLGAQVDLFTVNPGGEPPAGLKSVRLHPLAPASKGDLAFREQQCLAANKPLRQLLESKGPFDVVYERYSLWSYTALEYARQHSISALLEVNAPLIEEQAEFRGLVDRAGALASARRAFAAATALLAVSDEVASYLKDFGETRGKTRVLPNAVDPERFPLGIYPSTRPSTGFTVGFVGSMKPWHGVEDLIEAFARLPRTNPPNRILLVGEGPARRDLETRVVALELASAVHFTGAVSPAEVPGLLASMDVAVAPYRPLPNFYFSPLKVYEYMAASRAVVASALGQLKQIIQHGNSGWLVPPGDVPGLAAGLEHLRQSPTLRERLGQAARAKVLRDHTWQANAERILEIAGFGAGQLSPLPAPTLSDVAT